VSLALCLVLVAALSMGGCAYTTVATREKIPASGPLVPAGLEAIMVPVQDGRPWPDRVSTAPIPNVRIFSPQMTEAIGKGLVERGLFTKLVGSQSPEAKKVGNSLRIDITGFLMSNLGNNAWVVPHMLLNGTLLPVFTGTLVSTKAKVDMGGYLLPSTRMGTTITAKLRYREAGYDLPVLEREYIIKREMEQVSERRMLASLSEGESYGVEIGKEQGDNTLNLFIETIARDPRWAFLPQFRRLAKTDSILSATNVSFGERVEAVSGLLDLLKPLAYTGEEIKVLRDGYLDAQTRASIANDLRAQWMDLDSVKDLPRDQFVSEEQAEAFFTDPALPRAEVESILAEKALGQLTKVIITQEKKDRRADVLKAELRAQVVAKLKGQPRLQSLLLLQADKAVGADWAPMKKLLEAVDAPLVAKYLKKRS
jgi:hypothetical protein